MDKKEIALLMAQFDQIAPQTEDGVEFWYARELQHLLGYAQWRRFEEAITRAKEACTNSGYSIVEHFADVGKMPCCSKKSPLNL